MLLTPMLEGNQGIKVNLVQAVKQAFFNIGICLFKVFDKVLCFEPLAHITVFCIALIAVFGKAAGTLYEAEPVVPCPGLDIILKYAVERANKLHTLKISALKLGHHA